MKEQPIGLYTWLTRVKYALVAAGVFPYGNYGVLHFQIDEKSWRPLYELGLSPIKAVMTDIQEGGEIPIKS